MLTAWKYRTRNSLLERLDPRTRWIFSLTFVLSVMMFWDSRYLLFFFILGFSWYLLSRVSFGEARKPWLMVGFFTLLMVVVNTIITGGGTGGIVPPGGHLVWPEGLHLPLLPWTIHFGLTYSRLWFALCQLMRIMGMFTVFITMPYTTDPRSYGVTFRQMGFSENFAYSMDLAFRYIPTLARDFSTTIDAQRARGYEMEQVKGGIFQQVMRIAPLIVPITMNSILTGEDVTNAMNLRCFGQGPRTWLLVLRYHWYDYVVIGFSVLMLAVSLVLVLVFHQGGFWIPSFL
jgi:energy-coupling factor transport system permease protein